MTVTRNCPSVRSALRLLPTCLATVLILPGAAPATQTNWNTGDLCDMHFPQLPDFNGADVNFAS